jgi:RNA polymerase sigma-70 factor (ECF subfamily)
VATAPHTPSDEERDVRAAVAGDRAAYERLVALHQDGVFNLCLRFTGDFDAADDAAQETFIAALRAIPRFQGGNFRAWLFRITTNKCRDGYRATARRRQLPLEEEIDHPAESFIAAGQPAPTPEQHLDLVSLHAAIRTGLDGLPHDQREALVLRDINGLPYEEIGAILNVGLGTVKSRISRARARMRDFLVANRELLPDSARLPVGRSRT